MAKRLLGRILDKSLTLRGFRGEDDFNIVARIRNQATQGASLSAEAIASLLSSPERLCIAEAGREPAGFIFVTGELGPRLDELGTVEGESWLLSGPLCVPEFTGQGIEGKLLDWLLACARESGFPRLIKFTNENTNEQVNEALFEADFREKIRYYHMLLELATPPPPSRSFPDELKLIAYKGEVDFDMLWGVLEPAFEYLERGTSTYEQSKALFGTLKSAYFPICVESETERPVGTIALVSERNHGQIITFGVIPAFQRRGIGSLLMEKAIEHAWHQGIRTVDLAVRAENPKAISIYKRYGFQVIPRRTIIVLIRDN